jgi:hypothetical protein
MVQAEVLTLTELILHVRAQLLALLQQPASAANRTALTNLWRTCITIHDLAEQRGNDAYIRLMERLIDAIADYNNYEEPETLDWVKQLPTVDEIEAAPH